jgi:ribosome-binding factor A
MTSRRVFRLNSLLKEVLSEVIRGELHHVVAAGELISVASVEITPDLSYAKVFLSIIGDEKAKAAACASCNKIAGQIAWIAMKKVRLRTFPKLHFFLDEGLDKQMKILEILEKVHRS